MWFEKSMQGYLLVDRLSKVTGKLIDDDELENFGSDRRCGGYILTLKQLNEKKAP